MIPTDWLAARSRSTPDRLAVRDQTEELSYGELHARAVSVAAGLAGEGVSAGDRVAIDVEPSVAHAVLLHGALLAGAVAQPLRVGLNGAEREVALGRGNVPVLEAIALEHLTRVELRPLSPTGRGPADPAIELLTSGTTGEPKRVRLTYSNLLWTALGSASSLGLTPRDVWLCCLPLNHIGGLAILFRAVVAGIGVELHPRFDTDAVAEALGRDISIVSLVPTQLRRLLDAGAPLDRARALVIGGAPVPRELLDEAVAAGAPVVQTYGMTETSSLTTLGPGDAVRKLGSAGLPAAGTELRIEAGEILARGPSVAPGSAGGDGWLRTGDLGRIDDEGYLWVDGRADDLIISGGENVHPVEVEGVLEAHPAIAEAAVVGRPDREWGSAVTAVVVLAPGAVAGEEELRAHVREQLAPFKVPKHVELAESLPRTPGGKLLRRELR